jgi:multiple sugar transport system ATP-binding protein
VAEFIGSPAMNFLAGRIDPARRSAIGSDGAIEIAVGDAVLRAAAKGSGAEVTIGIRPEHLTVASPSDPGEGQLRLDGLVEVVEPLGAETMVEVNCRGKRLLVRIKGDTLPTVGEKLILHAERERFFYFDAASGRRLA